MAKTIGRRLVSLNKSEQLFNQPVDLTEPFMEKSRKGGRWPLWGFMQFVGISPYKALASNVGMFIDIKHETAVTRNKETGQFHYLALVPSPSLNSTFLHFL